MGWGVESMCGRVLNGEGQLTLIVVHVIVVRVIEVGVRRSG